VRQLSARAALILAPFVVMGSPGPATMSVAADPNARSSARRAHGRIVAQAFKTPLGARAQPAPHRSKSTRKARPCGSCPPGPR